MSINTTRKPADRQAGGRQARQAANPQTDLLKIKELIGQKRGQTDRQKHLQKNRLTDRLSYELIMKIL